MISDSSRYLTETHYNDRDDFVRDKARVIHSSYFRNLQDKTQIVTKNTLKINDDFIRTRLNHSLEVAQISAEIAKKYKLNSDIAEAVGYSHDVGHPPFGHNGETILNKIAENIGGFEGNAQTFRVLTRLSSKKFLENGRSVGLNLTREVLCGILKYPWLKSVANKKFSVYPQDINYFNWVRKNYKEKELSVYAQIMDFADDVAYSVADLEDVIITTNHKLNIFNSENTELIKICKKYYTNCSEQDLKKEIMVLNKLDYWVNYFDKSQKYIADVKNMTSELIERFVTNIKIVKNNLIIPKYIQKEIALLKSFSHIYFINTKEQIEIKVEQEKIIKTIYKYFSKNFNKLSAEFLNDYKLAKSEMLKKRLIIDQIATLTDTSITRLYKKVKNAI